MNINNLILKNLIVSNNNKMYFLIFKKLYEINI